MFKNRFAFFVITLLFIIGQGTASFGEDQVEKLIGTLKQDSPYFKYEVQENLVK